MLNLLIISNNSQAWRIQEFTRRLINVNVDIASDFDLGLEAVLEKRPAAVIIQERIWNVGAEGLVKHVQLLLGAGAPSFLLLHDSNPAARPVEGLFEHAIDMNLPEPGLTRETLLALRDVCDNDWNMVATEQAMHLLGETSGVTIREKAPEPPGLTEHDAPRHVPDRLQSVGQNISSDRTRADTPVADVAAPAKPVECDTLLEPPVSPVPPRPAGQGASDGTAPSPVTRAEDSPPAPDFEFVLSDAEAMRNLGIFESDGQPIRESRGTSSGFRRSLLVAGLVLSVAAAAAGYMVWRHPDRGEAPRENRPSSGPNAVAPPVSTPGNQPRAASPRPAPSPSQSVPSFVSPQGRDIGYSTTRPGWERYLDNNRDVRIFRVSGRIAAIQVLARPGREIADPFLRGALKELAGNGEPTTVSYEQRERGVIQRCRVGQRADLLLYRRASRSGVVVAFVMAFDDSSSPGTAATHTRPSPPQDAPSH